MWDMFLVNPSGDFQSSSTRAIPVDIYVQGTTVSMNDFAHSQQLFTCPVLFKVYLSKQTYFAAHKKGGHWIKEAGRID